MSLKIVITGGGGFLGGLLAKHFVGQQEVDISPTEKIALKDITLFDVVEPKFLPPGVKDDPRVHIVLGDLADKDTVTKVLQPNGNTRVTVFHLAGILSGQGEKDYDLCIKVNLFGSFNLLEGLRRVGEQLGSPQIIVHTSTNAVYAPTETITDSSQVLPYTTYGVAKASTDLLLTDATRKGFVSARIARLPSIIGRPEANIAASNAFSGIFRDPLNGKDFVCPIPLTTLHPVSSPTNLVNSLVYLSGKIDSEKLGHNRVVILPSRSYTPNQLYEIAKKVAEKHNITFGKVTVEIDPAVTAITDTWPPHVDHSRATALGLPDSIELDDIIEDYVQKYILTKGKE